jgi:hypothetical protein
MFQKLVRRRLDVPSSDIPLPRIRLAGSISANTRVRRDQTKHVASMSVSNMFFFVVRKAIERAQLSPGQDCTVHLVCQAYALLEANRRKSHDIIVRAVLRGIAHTEANCRLYLGLPASRPSCGSPAYTCLVRTEIASLVIKPSCPWVSQPIVQIAA